MFNFGTGVIQLGSKVWITVKKGGRVDKQFARLSGLDELHNRPIAHPAVRASTLRGSWRNI
jgi:hypothetical protein